MTIKINGQNENIDEADVSISKLLEIRNVPDPDMVSVQLNGDILERDDFSEKSLKNGDEVEFLYFMGGG